MLLAALIAAVAAAAATAYDPEANWPNPRAGIVEHEVTMAVDNRGRLLPAATVNIFGLVRPVSVHWELPLNGPPNILVAEKIGVIKIAHAWVGQPAGVLIDISERVASWGDHGLTGIELHDGFLYVTYMVAKAPWGQQGCTDHGQLEGRENDLASVQGCPISGRVSRFPYAAGAITGPEQIIVDGEQYGYCCQFSTHSVASPKLHDDGRCVCVHSRSRATRADSVRVLCTELVVAHSPPTPPPPPSHPPLALPHTRTQWSRRVR